VIPNELVKTGWEAYYQTAAASRNRGAAAGPIKVDSNYWKQRKPVEIQKWSARYVHNGKTSKMRVNNNVFSSVLGYFEQTPFMGLPCRLTSYTQKYFNQYKHGIPFIQAIDGIFKRLIPDRHAKQLAAAKETLEAAEAAGPEAAAAVEAAVTVSADHVRAAQINFSDSSNAQAGELRGERGTRCADQRNDAGA
jgi:hypothetical protein